MKKEDKNEKKYVVLDSVPDVEEDEIDLLELIRTLLQSWKLIFGITILCIALAVAYAFYLPEVLLEHTYPSGSWIQFHDKEWQKGIRFQKKETLQKLMEKSKKQKQPDNYELYKTYMKHVTIY